jgi:hypothetical protein
MKRSITTIGLLFVFLIAGYGYQNMKHDRNDIPDSVKIKRMGHDMRSERGMIGMRGGMDYRMMRGRGTGMMRDMGPGMRRGMGRMPEDSTGWMPMGTGRRMLESIPNVTESQKKQMADLIKKQHEEMQKLRDEMSLKMKGIKESHQKDIMKILTEEQRKFVETSGFPSRSRR